MSSSSPSLSSGAVHTKQVCLISFQHSKQ